MAKKQKNVCPYFKLKPYAIRTSVLCSGIGHWTPCPNYKKCLKGKRIYDSAGNLLYVEWKKDD